VRRTIEFLSKQPDAQDVIDHLEERLRSDEEHKRYFSVGFVNGTIRAVYPSADDPLRFETQWVSSFEEGLVRVDSDGWEDQVFVPRPDYIPEVTDK
jgi:hypothetical protein